MFCSLPTKSDPWTLRPAPCRKADLGINHSSLRCRWPLASDNLQGGPLSNNGSTPLTQGNTRPVCGTSNLDSLLGGEKRTMKHPPSGWGRVSGWKGAGSKMASNDSSLQGVTPCRVPSHTEQGRRGYHENGKGGLLRLSHERHHASACLSWITFSQRSRPPCQEDFHGAPWKHSHGEELRPPAKASANPSAICGSLPKGGSPSSIHSASHTTRSFWGVDIK